MPESFSKVQRWLALIAFLVGRRFPVEVDRGRLFQGRDEKRKPA